jgi:hypothetical protein
MSTDRLSYNPWDDLDLWSEAMYMLNERNDDTISIEEGGMLEVVKRK